MSSTSNTNVSALIQQLQDGIKKDMAELRTVEEELKKKLAEEAALKKEIPELEAKVRDEKNTLSHEQMVDIPKLRTHVSELQRKKALLQRQLDDAKRSIETAMHPTGAKRY